MSDSCFKKNDLLIPGTRQDQRWLPALGTTYILPDERLLPQLLVFIAKYAECVNYFRVAAPNQQQYLPAGDWQPLILSSEAFAYASLAITPATLPNIAFYNYVSDYETGTSLVQRDTAYMILWNILFSVYQDIDLFYTSLPAFSPLRNVIATEINNSLLSDLRQAIGAYLYATSENKISGFPAVPAVNPTNTDYKFRKALDVINGNFDTIWIDPQLLSPPGNWPGYVIAINNNDTDAAELFYGISTLSTAQENTAQENIDYSVLQLKQMFKRAFESYSRIISAAAQYLQDDLQNNSGHPAHHGLLLTFLKLFGLLQVDMNTLTGKHLDYYYTKVLQLNPAPAVADSVHIVFDPAKNVTSYLVAEGTKLDAGKDDAGNPLWYATDDEIVISQAQPAQLKTLFLSPVPGGGKVNMVYASPVANSADGNGAPFTGQDTSWSAFGDIRKNPVSGTEVNVADEGFYIASPILHLTEGNRIISFTFTTNAAGFAKVALLSSKDLYSFFIYSFSGEKGWEPLVLDYDTDSSVIAFTRGIDGLSFKIVITLSPQLNPVVGYNPAVCNGNLNTVYPVAKFALNQSTATAYETFKGIAITKIHIDVTVSNIMALTLQNEVGVLDPSKPLVPFGPSPKVGSAFYIGHPELVHKTFSNLNITLNWLGFNSNLKGYYQYDSGVNSFHRVISISNVCNSDFKVNIAFLRNKNWILSRPDVPRGFPIAYEILTDPALTLNMEMLRPDETLSLPDVFDEQPVLLTPQLQNGFMRITLTAPEDAFGNATWPKLVANQALKAATAGSNAWAYTIPNAPYVATLASTQLGYTAAQDINLDGGYKLEQGQFFNLMPFGFIETNSEVTLLPEFMEQVKDSTGHIATDTFESALLIGISGAVINQNISLLIQVNEGSEDIAIDSPNINWNYLSVTGWKHLNKSLLADSTTNLLQSGIVKIQVPIDINTNPTELPSGYTWIRASVAPAPPQVASNGLPSWSAVYSNAVEATYTGTAHGDNTLAANTITKLFDPLAAVKKTNQPYASFGGKPKEQGNAFYTRVSERLRDKNRAVTLWDYERLILGQYPDIYMVKCLNHSGYSTDCTKAPGDPLRKVYKENIAGHVMVLLVPFITNLQTGNIFQPTLSTAKRTDIQNFLTGVDDPGSCNKGMRALRCQLATLTVENPVYETIKVTCSIKVKQCMDADFYKGQLGIDLNNFLSPWINGDESKLTFGGKIFASQVVFFIERLNYIDYLQDLTIEQSDGVNILNTNDPSVAEATTSRSILTSIGNDADGISLHNINLVTS